MPTKVRKVKGKYRVSTPGGVKAKGTTKKKAMAQKRLLNGIEHGMMPRKKKMPMKKSEMKKMMGAKKAKKRGRK